MLDFVLYVFLYVLYEFGECDPPARLDKLLDWP